MYKKKVKILKVLKSINGSTSEKSYNKMSMIAKDKGLPVSRLIGFLIAKELNSDKPFSFIDLTIPTDEFKEYSYIDQAGKILDFLKTQQTGFSLDMLLILRDELNIRSDFELKMGFRDLIDKEFIIETQPSKLLEHTKVKYYKVKENLTPKMKRNKASKFETYLKLKKQFESEA